MSDVKMSKDYGIHTIELYLANLTYTEVQKVIDRLVENGQIHLAFDFGFTNPIINLMELLSLSIPAP